MHPVQLCRLSGRLREQARSHSWIAGCLVDKRWLSGRYRRQASSHSLIAGYQVDKRRLTRRQAALRILRKASATH